MSYFPRDRRDDGKEAVDWGQNRVENLRGLAGSCLVLTLYNEIGT